MMNNFVTLLTFTLPHEAYPVKALLESQGIEVFIRDEITAQVNNFISNAIGGVKLDVREEDYKQAMEVVRKAGYITEPDDKPASLMKLESWMTKVPFIGKLPFEAGLVIFIGALLLAIILPLVFLLD